MLKLVSWGSSKGNILTFPQFNIFNISPVLSIFAQKSASNKGNVKDCVPLGDHIFNISLF